MNSMNEKDLEKASTSAMNRVSEIASDLSEKAKDAKSQAKEWMGEKGDQLSATQKKLVDDATAYVTANPLKSVAIAAVAALVVGRLMR